MIFKLFNVFECQKTLPLRRIIEISNDLRGFVTSLAHDKKLQSVHKEKTSLFYTIKIL